MRRPATARCCSSTAPSPRCAAIRCRRCSAPTCASSRAPIAIRKRALGALEDAQVGAEQRRHRIAAHLGEGAVDASDRLKGAERSSAGLPSWLREDRLTGLHSREYFEELLQRDWVLAQRDSHEIGLTLFDIDDLGAYNEKFDRSAGDACIRRVAWVVGSAYRRRGDLVGRWEGGTFAVLTQGEAADKAT